MSDSSIREAWKIPLPTGDQPEAWLIDTTPWTWLRTTFGSGRAPYAYSTAGTRVRLVMPARGRARVEKVLAILTDHAERLQGDMHDEAGVPRNWTADKVATTLLVRAVYERQSPYVIYTVWPNGRVVAFSGRFEPPHYQRRSWHPDAPGHGEQ
jgi:hypothetical protein